MGETLFIAHRIPFPPDRGDKIRSHHLLKALAKLGPVHVAALAETEADYAAEVGLAEVAATHCLARRSRSLVLAGLRAIAGGRPVSLAAFDSAPLRAWITHTLKTRPIDTIFVFSGQMGQYVPPSFAGRVIIDLCDVDSAKFEAYGAGRLGVRGWVDRREGRLLAAEEARLARRADATLLISDAEATLLRSRSANETSTVLAVGNGVDTALFDPRGVAPHPSLVAEPGPHLVFTGQMDYPPNIAAVHRAALRIMPAVRLAYPCAQFHIVGRAPTGEVQALEMINGTRVWGEVADVRPFLQAADLVLAPLEIARGVQNKVLEAMAMARPVLLSPQAAVGIDALDGRDYAIGETDADLAARALELLCEHARTVAMGASARRFVIEHKSWNAALAPLAKIMGNEDGEARDAA